jgi:hypothetical protein
MAGERAQEFAKAAFVDQNYDRAFQLLSPQLRATTITTPEQLASELVKLHRGAFPSSVEATDYGRIAGQPAMSIFVHGVGVGGDIYYRLIMQGTAEQGYAIGGFMRGNGEYPQAMRSCLANCGSREASGDATPHN